MILFTIRQIKAKPDGKIDAHKKTKNLDKMEKSSKKQRIWITWRKVVEQIGDDHHFSLICNQIVVIHFSHINQFSSNDFTEKCSRVGIITSIIDA